MYEAVLAHEYVSGAEATTSAITKYHAFLEDLHTHKHELYIFVHLRDGEILFPFFHTRLEGLDVEESRPCESNSAREEDTGAASASSLRNVGFHLRNGKMLTELNSGSAG